MTFQRLFTFQGMICCAAVMVILWLLGWPLVMNGWAKSRWKEIPSKEASVPGQYMYVMADTVYLSSRRDFWQTNREADRGVSSYIGATDGTCWVNPKNPREVVHYLDAPANWKNATGRIAASTLILVAVVGILWGDRLRRRPRTAGGAAEGEGT
jgi:hypothetical protein